MEIMYPGAINSPATTLDGAINDSVQTIDVIDGSVLPDAPNLAVIGTGEDAETILYGVKTANQLTTVTRGFQGVAKAWDSGTVMARVFTEYDYASLKANIAELDGLSHSQNTDSLLSIAGALADHEYKGITDSQPVGENVVFGQLLYFDWTDTEWKLAKADAVATTPAMRIALETKGNGEACLMLVRGYIKDESAFEFTTAIGYLSITTAGAIQYAVPSVAGNQVQRIGVGISADILFFSPSIDVGEI